MHDLQVELGLRELWVEEPQQPYGSVLPESMVTYTTDKGLFLTTLPNWADEDSKDDFGPQIGCPVTFIKDYVQTIHRASAQVALDSGLLSLS